MFIAAVLALSAFSKPTLHLRLVYFSVSSFAFVKFGADTIFYFAVRDIAAILGFIFDLVFRAEMLFLSYLTARCFAIILIKFTNSPRTPCTVELHSVSNLASNLTRKLAAQTPESSSNLLKYQKRRFKYVSDYLKRREKRVLQDLRRVLRLLQSSAHLDNCRERAVFA